MVLAWVLYAEDHDGYLPPNPNGKASRGWVNGWLNFTLAHRDNTNVLFLIGTKAQVGHVYPKLGPYTSSAGLYKCPADIYMCEMGGTKMPRVRSNSMNGFVEGGEYDRSRSKTRESFWYGENTIILTTSPIPTPLSFGFLWTSIRTASTTAGTS
jgi:hypothetical protein